MALRARKGFGPRMARNLDVGHFNKCHRVSPLTLTLNLAQLQC